MNDPSKPSHCWTNGPWPLKTIETNGWMTPKPSKNHCKEWSGGWNQLMAMVEWPKKHWKTIESNGQWPKNIGNRYGWVTTKNIYHFNGSPKIIFNGLHINVHVMSYSMVYNIDSICECYDKSTTHSDQRYRQPAGDQGAGAERTYFYAYSKLQQKARKNDARF